VISLLSHFGSQFSYATVASKIAGRLASEHRLGGVMNLDDTVLPCHAETLQLAQGSDAHSPLQLLLEVGHEFEGRRDTAKVEATTAIGAQIRNAKGPNRK